uniref:DNA helicase n=1 Tax=Candidatus Kentrum sp. SD TaxID=2126332 RepID=A0A450Z7W4_9GAMM|nr:MAG: hypothetical protein BECKSD772F_GA0070984_12813 [Candidatus Kentron sp. SD]VFK49874.1 MAG: hypothetical protein BECKSD772E_GA0070983_12672 [Candidatus Kentron sp. SD]
MKKFRQERIQSLRLGGQKVAVITYTNAACDEIKARLDYDASFQVSTIYGFSWELIKPYQNDIRAWLRKRLLGEIAVLQEKQQKGRAGSKAALDRPRQIDAKQKRLNALERIKRFAYNPSGENPGRDFLNHAEVIAMTTTFLLERPLMQRILIRRFPILLIDESQDAHEELIDAFFQVQSAIG